MAELSTLGSVIKTAYEAETDTNAFTDAEQTKLSGVETSADVTDTANVTSAGALMDSEVTNLAQVKSFDSSDYVAAPTIGTFTPELWDASSSGSESQTYSEQTGNYIKQGRLCYFEIDINVTSAGTLTGADQASISLGANLPDLFATNALTSVYIGFASSMAINAGETVTGTISGSGSGKKVNLKIWNVTTGNSNLTITEFGTARLCISGTYITAS